MSSQHQKNKSKRAGLSHGGEKNSLEELKLKGIAYYTKRDRLKAKTYIRKVMQENNAIAEE